MRTSQEYLSSTAEKIAKHNEHAMFVRISKRDDAQQIVEGYASTSDLDSQGDVITLQAIKAAVPGYMEWGAVREMHQPSAVGTAVSADVDAKGLRIAAKIVDAAAWRKVVEGVYKGFSIGGRVVERIGHEIHKINLMEISLVDRPANPACKIDVWKRDPDADYLARVAALDHADAPSKPAAIELLAKAESLGGDFALAARLYPDVRARMVTESLPESLLPSERVKILSERSGVAMNEILKADFALQVEYDQEMTGTHPIQKARDARFHDDSRRSYSLRKAATADGLVPLAEVEVFVGGVAVADTASKAAWVELAKMGHPRARGVTFRGRGAELRAEDVQS